MQFNTWLDFIHMGGHGFYVWLSFGVSILVLMINIVGPWLSIKGTEKSLARRFQRESKGQ
jgi:heme exporter protein D